MRHHTSCFRPSTSCLSDHLPRGGGSERESRGRGIGNLPGDFGPPWTEVSEVWVRDGRMLHNSDKEFALTMGADAECSKAGARGRGGVQEPEGGREAASPTTYPNELIRIYKD